MNSEILAVGDEPVRDRSGRTRDAWLPVEAERRVGCDADLMQTAADAVPMGAHWPAGRTRRGAPYAGCNGCGEGVRPVSSSS
jgi:hypothetical protein